jgi:thymidylate synthase (FAD)
MPQTKPSVKIIGPTDEDAVQRIYTAARTCYSSVSPLTIYDRASKGTYEYQKMMKLITRCLHDGHHSVIEHISVTIMVEGVSRVLTHQLVRHRLVSYSQQSQRYVSKRETPFDFIIPPAIEDNRAALSIFLATMEYDYQMYCALYDCLYESYTERGMDEAMADKMASEDARFIMPNAAASNIVCTVNLRELIHIFNERTCQRAQWEIRVLFGLIKAEMVKLYPWIGRYLVPKCNECKETDMCERAVRRSNKEVS